MSKPAASTGTLSPDHDKSSADEAWTDGDPALAPAPHPGSQQMPRWNVGELIEAPVFTARNWFAMLGPGLLMGGAAIGGGEWLMGPTVTARYGGALMWLASMSILGQVVYNIEISRYALYTGEPIFTGKFRTLPGPMFWLFMYLILDFGSVFPYLAASAATPAAAVWLGQIPDSSNPAHTALIKNLGYAIFILALVPLIFGGKIYNSLKVVMTVKIFVVMGFLLVLGIFYSHWSTWTEVFSGFAKIGNIPTLRAEDTNGNGILDPGEEDWDGDRHADVLEPQFGKAVDSNGDGKKDDFDLNADGKADTFISLTVLAKSRQELWPDFDGDGKPDESPVIIVKDKDGNAVEHTLQLTPPAGVTASKLIGLDTDGDAKRSLENVFVDFDGDSTRDGDAIVNVFASLAKGEEIPTVDLSMIAFLAAFVAIAGSGGLSNAPTSNYTRDQGWGMGHHVGAIPSVIGSHDLQLSHVGTVFHPTAESLPRWRRWYKHVCRDQLAVWMPACFLGIALPSMLSVEFLKRGTVADQWTSAGMTADGVYERVSSVSGSSMGNAFWFMTLICGFLVLAPTMASSIDGIVRRWVDVFWTASPQLRQWDTRGIRYLYFFVLISYAIFGLFMLSQSRPQQLIVLSTSIMNFALGFSCWHTVFINRILLPKPIRPGLFMSSCLVLAGAFFWGLATISALKQLGYI